MFNEQIFLYQLYAALYKNGCNEIDISNEHLKKSLPYLKTMLELEKFKEIESIFTTDEYGIYSNYLNTISNLDPLFCGRENDKVKLYINEEMANLFYDEEMEYIGPKMAAYIKIKEKEKIYYENN